VFVVVDRGFQMLRHRGRSLIQVLLLTGLLCVPATRAQGVYSYVDQEGVRVFTNIPPRSAAGLSVREPLRSIQTASETDVRGGITEKPTASLSSSPKLGLWSLPAATEFDPIIDRYATVYQLDPALVKSIIATESGFNSRAVSHKGAQGLMQLMPATAARLGVSDAFNAEENIRGGMKHLRTLLDTFQDDLVLSLAAYNAGENLVQRIGRVPGYRETHDYVRAVTARYGRRSMSKPPAPPSAPPPRPVMFRFLDDNGILQLTNIPPVPRVESPVVSTGSSP
jgi:hypothetical protein